MLFCQKMTRTLSFIITFITYKLFNFISFYFSQVIFSLYFVSFTCDFQLNFLWAINCAWSINKLASEARKKIIFAGFQVYWYVGVYHAPKPIIITPSFLRRCVSMSVLLFVRNDPNLLDFTIVSHSLVLFWRNWRINSKPYWWWGEKFMHMTETYDVPSWIGILVTDICICAEKRNYWWQSENTKELWISYTNSQKKKLTDILFYIL